MEWWHYVLTFLGSSAVISMVQFFISRHDQRRENKEGLSARINELDERLDEIKHRLDKSERDSCRLQLMVMLSDFPEDVQEIMTIAEHYFVDLVGDWYMTSIFNKWLEKNEIAKPEWFK